MAAPKLRFKEFDGDWSIKPLKNICKINQGLQIAIENRFTDDSENRYFYITNEFLREGAKKTYFIENPPHNVICDENDILMTRTGNTGQVVTDVKGAFHNNFFKIDFDRSTINKNFFIEFLKKDTTQHLILKYAGASTIPDLNHSDFYRIQMPITSLEEQTKIAAFLSAVDEKISQLTQKHQLLSQYKQGMMQKLFSQQLRFKADDGSEFGEWEEKKLGDICSHFQSGKTITSATISDNGAYPVFGGNGLRGFTDTYTHDGIFALIGRQGALCGNINLVQGENFISEHAIAVQANQESSTQWLAIWLDFMQLNRFSESSAQAGLAVNKLVKFDIKVPCLEEQTKIANFLSVIDQKIEVIAQQIEQAKTWKKGLLQQMFV